jgi:hypothetical protein
MSAFVGVMADPALMFVGVVEPFVVIGGPSVSALAFVGVVGLLVSSFVVGGPSALVLVPVVVEGHVTSLRVVVVVGPL